MLTFIGLGLLIYCVADARAQGGKRPRRVTTAVPPGAEARIDCFLPKDKSSVLQRKWHRVSDSKDLFLNDIWLRYPDVSDWPDKSKTYSVQTTDTVYTLTIRNVSPREAGEYRCKITTSEGVIKDQTVGIVTVIERPTCSPPTNALPDLREGSPYFMNCSARVFGGRVKDLQWSIGKRMVSSKREDGENRATSILEYIPNFKDFGSSARCEVVHPRWNHSYAVGSCEYKRLVVQFDPRLSCTRNRVAVKKAADYRIWCNYTSYPQVAPGEITWVTSEGESLNRSMHKELVRKIDLGFQAVLIVKSQVFEKFDADGNALPLTDAQTMKYDIIVRDKNGKQLKKEGVSLTLNLNESVNQTQSDSVIGIFKDWRVLIGILAAFSVLVIIIILIIVIVKKGLCKSEKSHDLNGTGSDLGRDDMGYNPELPVGGAFDIGRLDGSSSMTMDNGGNNGSASSEFYHSGKNKGSLRFDRY